MFPSSFGNDPFFMDPYEQMNRMMTGFSSPLFSSPFEAMHMPQRMLQIDNGMGRQQQLHSMHNFPPSPFGGMLQSMNSMNGMMGNMQRGMMSFPSVGSGSHSFQSSTVIMQNNGSGPRVIQSSSSARMGPDGVKETRQSHKDSETGEMRMAVGHHINDRAHVMEKSKNRRTGDEEEKQEYINIEEEEAESFNDEWMQKMRSSSAPRHHHHRGVAYHAARQSPYNRHDHQRRRPHTAAITYKPPNDETVSREQITYRPPNDETGSREQITYRPPNDESGSRDQITYRPPNDESGSREQITYRPPNDESGSREQQPARNDLK